MQTRKIGSLDVSVVGLGCNNFGWRIDAEASAKVIDAALESGITFFDTADRYGKGQSEDFLGRARSATRSNHSGDEVRDGNGERTARRVTAVYPGSDRGEFAPAEDRSD